MLTHNSRPLNGVFDEAGGVGGYIMMGKLKCVCECIPVMTEIWGV